MIRRISCLDNIMIAQQGAGPQPKNTIFGHFEHLSSLGHVITAWIALNLIEIGNPKCVLLDSVTKF